MYFMYSGMIICFIDISLYKKPLIITITKNLSKSSVLYCFVLYIVCNILFYMYDLFLFTIVNVI